jgi:hypothetical protein
VAEIKELQKRKFKVQVEGSKSGKPETKAYHRGSRGAAEGTEMEKRWIDWGHGRRRGSGIGDWMDFAVLEELADGVPVGASAFEECLGFHLTKTGDERVADVIHGGGFFGRDGLRVYGLWKIRENLKVVGPIKMFPGKRREMTRGTFGAGGAIHGVEVGQAKTVTLGIGGESAVAAVGQGEAAEGRARRIGALTGHGGSLAHVQYTYK